MQTSNIDKIRSEIQQCSERTETIYTRLGDIFPSLLAIVHDTDPSSSLSALEDLLGRIQQGLTVAGDDEAGFFIGYNERNTQLFTELGDRMKALSGVHEHLEVIRRNSEDLELISLNAMVISIKSGEKGRAFSCITENLKLLSASMISLSNELMLEEKKLLKKNDDLENSFSVITASMHDVSGTKGVSVTEHILPVMDTAAQDLKKLSEKADTTTRPIRQAMTGIQLQDIVRQSIDQVLLVTKEILPVDEGSSTEEQLDRISFNLQVMEICEKVIHDVHANVLASIKIFTENWETVHQVLNEVESLRKNFLSVYLDYSNKGGRSLPVLLDQATNNFSEFIAQITVYQRAQKTMVSDSASIVTEVKYLRRLFEMIRPIIARLQHVRITQQIEVAKNDALQSVRSTVDEMSDLIYRTQGSVEETRQDLEAFIGDIEKITEVYSVDARKDTLELDRIKKEKTEFFKTMRNNEDTLTSMLSSLRVYPDSFQSLCLDVDSSLLALGETADVLKALKEAVSTIARGLRNKREPLLTSHDTNRWTIRNDRLRELVERFTITAHKEEAGKVGGFALAGEGLESIESGDVTLFF